MLNWPSLLCVFKETLTHLVCIGQSQPDIDVASESSPSGEFYFGPLNIPVIGPGLLKSYCQISSCKNEAVALS